MTRVLHWVATNQSYSPINILPLPAHHGHNVRVTFLAHPVLCTIFIVPRTTIYEVRGDFREPETNPDYSFIGTSRSVRLERVAESLMLRKLFGAWRGNAFQSRANVADGDDALQQSTPPSKLMQACVEEKEEEEIMRNVQDEDDELRTASPWPVRSGFQFSAFSECLLRGPAAVDIVWQEGDLTDGDA